MSAEGRTGWALAALTFAFVLSQFFRACLAVIAPELQHDLGLSPAGFGALSSCFFLAFAVAQLPVGIAFDRFGTGRPTALLLALGVASGLGFALAPGGASAMLAQVGLGIACAPVFMGLIHYASENLSEARFTRVVGWTNGVGMLGALCATAPLGWAAHRFGWRPALLLATACMGLACMGVGRWVRDQGHADARRESPAALLRASLGLLRLQPLWTLIPLCVGMAAGSAFRNAWAGPYLADVFGLGPAQRGMVLTVVGFTAFGSALVLPGLVRRSTVKATVLGWTLMCMAAGLGLALLPAAGLVPGMALLAVLATAGMVHPLVMVHGRGMMPPSLRGRGLGLLNSFVFLGSAITSWAFGWIAERGAVQGLPAAATYGRIFLAAVGLLVLGALPYLFSPPAGGARGAAGTPAGG